MGNRTSTSPSPKTFVGAARSDITPPLNVGILMSSVERRWAPFESVRSPLLARAIFLRKENLDAADAIAIVSLDLLALSDTAVGGWAAFKNRIADAAGRVVNAERIVLACSHTHCGPESVALTDLCKTPQYQAWIARLADSIGRAIASAASAARACRLECGVTVASGWGIFRRIHTTHGILLSHPPPPEEIVLSRGGPVDDSVNVLIARDTTDGKIVAMVVNATCHPVHEMCIRQISPDFPGVLATALEQSHSHSIVLFVNGAAGNINPRTVSAGPDASRRHGLALAGAVDEIIATGKMEACGDDFALIRRKVSMPSRLPNGQSVGNTLQADIVGLRVGSMAFAFLPGEPFVETGLNIREHSPFETTVVVGYAENYIGYVPTDAAFIEGGYETAFGRWSVLANGCEPALFQATTQLLDELHIGVTRENRSLTTGGK